MVVLRIISGESHSRIEATPDNVALMESMLARIADAPGTHKGVLAAHVADVMIALSGIVASKFDGHVELGGWQRAFSHTCDRHIEAALYLLAHAFNNPAEGSSRVLVWADRVVKHLIESDD